MARTETRTFSLPEEDAVFVDEKVASGAYESPSDVLRAGLSALRESDAAFDRWVQDEVLPVYRRMKADPSRGIPAEQVLAELRAHHEKRIKSRG